MFWNLAVDNLVLIQMGQDRMFTAALMEIEKTMQTTQIPIGRLLVKHTVLQPYKGMKVYKIFR